MRILEFLFFMIFFWRASSSTNSNEQYNAAEFRHLCKILKVAEGEPPQIPDELGKFLETRKILEKLLRATQTSTATYQKVLSLKHGDKEDAEFISYTVKRRIANEKIRHALEKVQDIHHRMEEELIQAKKERTLARNNLVHAIYGVQVGEIPKEEDIALVLKNVSRGSISNYHGGHKDAKMVNVFSYPWWAACGGTGTNGAGFTLINDFYCLCVGVENNHTACHEDIRGPGWWNNKSVDWHAEEKITCECKDCDSTCNCCGGKCTKEGNKCVFYCNKGKCDECKKCKDNCCNDGKCCCCCCKDGCNCTDGCCKDGECCRPTPYGVLEGTWLNMTDGNNKSLDLPEGWPHIRKACQEVFKELVPTTAESIQEVLDGFNKLLGANSSKKEIIPTEAAMDARRLFVLGYARSMEYGEAGCRGAHKHTQRGDSGLCLNYWSVSNLGAGIVWQNYMLEAQKHLQEMDKHIQKAQHLSRMIQKLKESAEESYRNSTHGTFLWSEDHGFRENIWHHFSIFLGFFS